VWEIFIYVRRYVLKNLCPTVEDMRFMYSFNV
jgi:hypothetical protein